ncbi:MAG: aspartyl/asparaginyl beta-hydroxylase domain-containing protein, partial [Cyanobacteria bacterium J06641_5]
MNTNVPAANPLVSYGKKAIQAFEAGVARASLVPDLAFLESDTFAWIAALEANHQTIRQELDRVMAIPERLPNFQDISVEQYNITQDNRWKTFFLYAYGIKAEANCDRCPETTRLLEQIPGMKTAFFSILLPGKHIPEHRGPYKGVLRYHLGLRIPEPADRCGIRVGGEVRHWQEGKSLLFDDTFPHSAWNDTDDIRVVLFLDIVRPLSFPWLVEFSSPKPLDSSCQLAQ